MSDSVLRDFFGDMNDWDNDDKPLDHCKEEAINFIENAPFKNKGRAVINRQEMIDNVNSIISRNELMIYLGNSLLAFEGLRTIKGRQIF